MAQRYPFGVLGDSSLYCKGLNKKPRKLGNRLQELLGASVWYEAIACAGVAQLLHKIRSGPEVGTLGVSYFGNDIMLGPIKEQVEADWREFIRAVKLKSQQAVFVIGGFAAKYRGLQLSADYDHNLEYVRSLVESEGLYVTDLRQKVRKWRLCSDGVHWHDDEKEDVCATWVRLLQGEVFETPFPDLHEETQAAEEDSMDSFESPISSPREPQGPAPAACWGRRPRQQPQLPSSPRVPRLPKRPLPLEDSQGRTKQARTKTFSVTVFRQNPYDRLGIRMEAVSGAGYSSAARVRRILEGGLIDRWNRMQEENGLHGWGVQVDDVIVGMNGQREFSTSSLEFQTATELNLLVMRGMPTIEA